MIGPAEIEDMMAEYAEALVESRDVPVGVPVWLADGPAASEARGEPTPAPLFWLGGPFRFPFAV